MIELSVVTGTYNRLPHLQRMIASTRQSIGVGIPYEIVLVDGGSTDGTIGWAKSQSDIVLIEQGELLGAVKAFNAGLRAARGRYCVVANDDITFIDETLLNALSFMHEHPNVGIGCFYQDREHPGRFDLSYMPVVMNGKQMQHIYGQVCIVPRWLGDEVGWWGTYTHTYGGDNNLSSYVLEKGYKVEGVKCACIHDMKVIDALRRANNEDRMTHARSHPDSELWGKYWTHKDGTCGPILKLDGPYKANPLNGKVRFLYLPIYEQGHDVQKQHKRGLRDALARYGLVYEYDWLSVRARHGSEYMRNYMMDIMDSWHPHVLLTQIHTPDASGFDANIVGNIRREFPHITWANWNGDYHPDDLLSGPNVRMAKLFDLQCVVTTQVESVYTQAGARWMYWQIGWERGDTTLDNHPSHDVVFLANGYSGARLKLGHALRVLNGVNVGIYGSWRGIRVDGYNLYDFSAGAEVYRNAKLAIGDDQWGAPGYVSNRLFQAMSAGGAMYMQQQVPQLEELLGMVDGVHYVAWKDIGDLMTKIRYWLHPDRAVQRKRIADSGTRLMHERHTFDNRVRELMEALQ